MKQSKAIMASSGYVPNIHHPEIMRSILAVIVETGDVIGAAGTGRTILAFTVGNWLIDELVALGSDGVDREAELDEDDGQMAAPGRRRRDGHREPRPRP